MDPNPPGNAKCDVVMKLPVFGTRKDTHTHTRKNLIIIHYILATRAVYKHSDILQLSGSSVQSVHWLTPSQKNTAASTQRPVALHCNWSARQATTDHSHNSSVTQPVLDQK